MEQSPVEQLGTRASVLARWIREKIISGELSPDTHLQELALAEQLGTSRTPVREALKLLEREHLVLYSPNRGYVVRRFALKDILDAFDVRATLEGMACRLVAERGVSEETAARLHELLKQMEAIAVTTTWGNTESLVWFDLNAKFHRVIIAESRNEILSDTIERTQRLPLIFDSELRLRDPSQVSRLFEQKDTQRSYEDHVELVDAIVRGDGAAAEVVMRRHIGQSRNTIQEKFGTVYSKETQATKDT